MEKFERRNQTQKKIITIKKSSLCNAEHLLQPFPQGGNSIIRQESSILDTDQPVSSSYFKPYHLQQNNHQNSNQQLISPKKLYSQTPQNISISGSIRNTNSQSIGGGGKGFFAQTSINSSMGLDQFLHRNEKSLNIMDTFKMLNRDVIQREDKDELFCREVDKMSRCSSRKSQKNQFYLTAVSENQIPNQNILKLCNIKQIDNDFKFQAKIKKEQLEIKEQELKERREIKRTTEDTLLPNIFSKQNSQRNIELQQNQQKGKNFKLDQLAEDILKNFDKTPHNQENLANKEKKIKENQLQAITNISNKGNFSQLLSGDEEELEFSGEEINLEEREENTFNLNDHAKEKKILNIFGKNKFETNNKIKSDAMIYDIKQLLRLQRKREKLILQKLIKPEEMLEYIRKRNQIMILHENSKKIKSLKSIANEIEKEISKQNDKINEIIQQMLINFGLVNKEK